MSAKKKSESGDHPAVKALHEELQRRPGSDRAAEQTRALQRIRHELDRWIARGQIDPEGARSTIRQSVTDIGEFIEWLERIESESAAGLVAEAHTLQSSLSRLEEESPLRSQMIGRFVHWRERALHEIDTAVRSGDLSPSSSWPPPEPKENA